MVSRRLDIVSGEVQFLLLQVSENLFMLLWNLVGVPQQTHFGCCETPLSNIKILSAKEYSCIRKPDLSVIISNRSLLIFLFNHGEILPLVGDKSFSEISISRIFI